MSISASRGSRNTGPNSFSALVTVCNTTANLATEANPRSTETIYACAATTVPSETVPTKTWATPIARKAPRPNDWPRTGTVLVYWSAIPSLDIEVENCCRIIDHLEKANCSHAAALIDSAEEITSEVNPLSWTHCTSYPRCARDRRRKILMIAIQRIRRITTAATPMNTSSKKIIRMKMIDVRAVASWRGKTYPPIWQ